MTEATTDNPVGHNIEAEAANEISVKVTAQAKSCAEDLAKAEPAVEEAMKALNTLNKKDLSECKSMLKPPAGVHDIFAATQVLLGTRRRCGQSL